MKMIKLKLTLFLSTVIFCGICTGEVYGNVSDQDKQKAISFAENEYTSIKGFYDKCQKENRDCSTLKESLEGSRQRLEKLNSNYDFNSTPSHTGELSTSVNSTIQTTSVSFAENEYNSMKGFYDKCQKENAEGSNRDCSTLKESLAGSRERLEQAKAKHNDSRSLAQGPETHDSVAKLENKVVNQRNSSSSDSGQNDNDSKINNDIKSSGTIKFEEYESNKKARKLATEKRKLKAIEKFYESAAVLTSTLSDYERKLMSVSNLTSKLDSATGKVVETISNIDEKGGQFDKKDGQVDGVIDTKKQKLKNAIIGAERELTDAKNKYEKCKKNYYTKHNSCRTMQSAVHQAERKVSQAKKNYQHYLTYGEIKDQEQKGPSMENAKDSIEAGEASVNNSLADGERLYSAQEDLNAFINNNTRTAIALAQDAKRYASELVRLTDKHSNYEVTDSAKTREFKKDGGNRDQDKILENFDESKSSSLVSEDTVRNVLARMEGNNDAANVTDLFAITSSAAENFKCSNSSDVECTSYHLLVAASAIYLASEIQDEADYRANIDDIFKVDDNPDEKMDKQYKEMERAARMREQLLESALNRAESKQILTDMIDVINTIAILEHQAKIRRIAAAKQQVEKAKKFLKKSEISFAIFVALELLERKFGIMNATLGKIYAACCNPTSSGCCVKSPVHFSKSQMWWAKQAFSAAKIIYYGSRIIKAKKELKRAKAELARAEKHTHMSCRVDRQGVAIRDRIDNFFKAARFTTALFTSAIIPLAHAEDVATATGLNKATALYDYYTVAKFGNSETKGAAYEMAEAFPTPETRHAYTTKLLMLGYDVGAGMGNITDEIRRQKNIYNQLVQDMDDRMIVHAKSQGPGTKDEEELDEVSHTKTGVVSKFRPGGALSTTEFATQGNRERGKGKDKVSSGDLNKGNFYSSSALGRSAKSYKNDFEEAKNGMLERMKKNGMDVHTDSSDSFDKYRAERSARLKGLSGNKKFSSLIKRQLDLMDKSKDDAKKKIADDAKDKKKSGVKLKTKGSKGANEVASGKGKGNGPGAMDSNVSMYFGDDDSATVADDDASLSELGAKDADRKAGEEALASMENSAYGRYENSDNTSKEKGIYDGDKTLFGILSNRYIKTALPVFFEKKKK